MRIINFLRIAALSLALIGPGLSVAYADANDGGDLTGGVIQRNGAGAPVDANTGVQLPGTADY